MMIIEIHMGVMVSPAPRMTPERDWVMALAKVANGEYLHHVGTESYQFEVSVKIAIRFLPKTRIRRVITAEVPSAMAVP